MDEYTEPSDLELLPCEHCGRRFNPQSLAKHENVCTRITQKRPTFDSGRQRKRDIEPAEYCQPWTCRQVTLRDRSASSMTKTNETCPHCKRTFKFSAYDDHVRFCREQVLRNSIRSSSKRKEHEQFKARMKYQPPPIKSRRSINKEKYSANVKKNDTVVEKYDSRRREIEDKQIHEIDFKYKDKPKESHKETNFIRRNVARCSIRNKSPKRTDISHARDHSSQRNQSARNKQNDHRDDYLSVSSTKKITSLRPRYLSNSSSIPTYDPYASAENQFKALLDPNGNEPLLNETFVVASNKENMSDGPVKTISCQTEASDGDFKLSPKSAFTKYSTRASTPIPKSDFEKEDFSITVRPRAETATYDSNMNRHCKLNEEANMMNRYPLISLSNISLCSSMSLDIPESKNGIVKRADDRSELATKPKTNLKMENLLYGDETQNSVNDFNGSFSDFEHILRSFDTVPGDTSPVDYAPLTRGDSLNSKVSTDSAYNSLNRKSPTIPNTREFGRNTSTPESTADTLKSSTFSINSDDIFVSNSEVKLSKFCHECGAKFPVAAAKFCCECGVRRLLI